MINEPVAAALCYVLGGEGLAFSALAVDQRIMVWDLGGGTFDLSLVRYTEDEVSVIASAGDLELGGIDWTKKLQNAIADQFKKEFKSDPREDAESLQFLRLEAEQTKAQPDGPASGRNDLPACRATARPIRSNRSTLKS